MVLTEKQKKEL